MAIEINYSNGGKQEILPNSLFEAKQLGHGQTECGNRKSTGRNIYSSGFWNGFKARKFNNVNFGIFWNRFGRIKKSIRIHLEAEVGRIENSTSEYSRQRSYKWSDEQCTGGNESTDESQWFHKSIALQPEDGPVAPTALFSLLLI